MKRDRKPAVAESFIVRIYRRDLDNPEGMVGLVETVGSDQVKKFSSGRELLRLIGRRDGGRRDKQVRGGDE